MGIQPIQMQLDLQLGAAQLEPISDALMSALERVQVQQGGELGSGFQLSFVLKELDGEDFALLNLTELAPWSRVLLRVRMFATGAPTESVLIDGVITHHQVGFDIQQQLATLTITGRDFSLLFDLKERADTYVNATPADVVSQIAQRPEYQDLRLRLELQLPDDVAVPCWAQPGQTDLQCLQLLARRCRSVFFIDPIGTDGQRRLYFGKPELGQAAELPLYVLAGARSNVSALAFALDAERPVRITGQAWNDRSELTELPEEERSFPRALAAQPIPAVRTRLLGGVGAHDPTLAQQLARAAAATARPAVSAEVTLDTLRYGAVLGPRQLISVMGAGQSYGGAYSIESVTHTISRGSYQQQLKLSREGLGAR